MRENRREEWETKEIEVMKTVLRCPVASVSVSPCPSCLAVDFALIAQFKGELAFGVSQIEVRNGL